MSEVPDDLNYTKTHEWVRSNDDGTITVGITDHAQAALGDLVFVECPVVGSQAAAEDACAVVESVKAASDIYAPASGEIVATNDTLADSPDQINEDPYDGGWIFKMRLDNEVDLDRLLDADAYRERLEAED